MPAAGNYLVGSHKIKGDWIVLAVCISLCQGCVSYWLCSKNNDFPIEYHPDEVSKVDQIGNPGQPRNFNQPLLLIESANIVRRLSGLPMERTLDVAIAGRRTSAIFASVAVFAMSMAGYAYLGLRGSLLAGTMLAFCPPLVVYGHYFKEDVALVAGIAISLLGAKVFVTSQARRLSITALVILGVGCGIAGSAKYIGSMMLVPSIAIVVCRCGHGRKPGAMLWSLGIVIMAFSCVVLVVNSRMLERVVPPRMYQAAGMKIRDEVVHGIAGQDGIALRKPNLFHLQVSASELMLHAWIFLLAGAFVLGVRRRIGLAAIVSVLFVLSPIVVLSANAIPFARYALPVTVMAYFMAAEAAVAFVMFAFRGAAANVVMSLCVLVVVFVQGTRCIHIVNEFREDSRQELREWVAQHVPRGSRVAIDSYTLLDGSGDPRRYPNQAIPRVRIVSGRFAADLGRSVKSMAAARIEYVAVAAPSYDRFFVSSIHALPGAEKLLQHRQDFYRDLFENGDLVWQSKSPLPTHSYVDPELRLYRIRPELSQDSTRTVHVR